MIDTVLHPQVTPPVCKATGQTFEFSDNERNRLDMVSPVIGGVKMSIPAPTLCPAERVRRRMAWRNDRTFYKRICDFSGEEFVSMYAPDTRFPVYKQDAWHGDGWDGLAYGKEMDLTRPFFEQWGELRDTVPHWGVAIANCENSDYCNYCTDEKNCYLDIAAERNEDCYYNLFTKYSTNCVDCTFVYNSTLCHESIQCYGSYNLRNCMYMDNCSDCAFCYDCIGCKNCLLSINLRNKEYCILNEQHTKEEYEKKLKELHLDTAAGIQMTEDIWGKIRIEKGIYRDMYAINCENSIGNNLKNCKNCFTCFNTTNCEDCAYLYDVLDAKNCQDMNYSLYDPESCYEIISTVGNKFCAFTMAGPYNNNIFYCQMCQSCSDCFGCVGLKHKQYCIFNKQYSKQEYETLVPKIVDHMKETGEWGEFFPIALSPHAYNETVAQEYMPVSKEEALQRQWAWNNEKTSVVGKKFNIIEQEKKFYEQQGIPEPIKSPDERHMDRMRRRNPRMLWNRTCSECGTQISTSFSPQKPEKVCCEKCYRTHLI